MSPSPLATALIVVDMQAGFVSGDEASPQMPTVLPAVQQQIGAARAADSLVIFLQNDGPAGAVDEPETPGWQLAFQLSDGDFVVRKRLDSGFAGTDLGAILQQHRIETLSICGVMSEMCVAATARDAMARGFTVILAHDSHGTHPIPAFDDGEPEVPADLAARAAEWSLGDTVQIPARSTDVQFGQITGRVGQSANAVRLSGTLVCADSDEVAMVRHHLPLHVTLTRAEPGCESFEVSATDDPLVWLVEERFSDSDAFRTHQARVAASEWGEATRGIERRYEVTGLQP